jgi:hypothetical protein
LKPQPRRHANITHGILKPFTAQVFPPIKIPNKVKAPTIALLEPRNGVTDAVWQSAFGLVGGGGG